MSKKIKIKWKKDYSKCLFIIRFLRVIREKENEFTSFNATYESNTSISSKVIDMNQPPKRNYDNNKYQLSEDDLKEFINIYNKKG